MTTEIRPRPVPRTARHRPPTGLGDRRADPAAAVGLASASALFRRRVVREGEFVYRAGDRFTELYVLDTGACKLVDLTADGREQIVSFKFCGDWMALDGFAQGRHFCDAIALDTCAVWHASSDAVLAATRDEPALLASLLGAMGGAIVDDRIALRSVCTLPADARVAEFLRFWVRALRIRGLRSDEIALRLTRAEIGNYLGVTFETVSRALSKLARENLIAFTSVGHRELRIPDADALEAFVSRSLAAVAVQ